MFEKKIPLEVMQNSVVSTQILAKIYRSWIKECDYHKIYDQKCENCILHCKSIFSVHIFNAFRLAVLSYRPSSFDSQVSGFIIHLQTMNIFLQHVPKMIRI